MALDFPANPTNGQAYGAYIYNATVGAWQSKEDPATVAVTSDVAPTSASNGDIWYNTTTGVSYVYYNDGNSGQWVEIVSSAVPNLNTKANLDGGNSFTGTQTFGTPIGLSSGGTNASLTGVNGGVVWSSATALGIIAAGTSGQVLKSNGAAAPSWQTLDLSYLPDAAFKKSVKAATTANITLSGTQTIDGIALVAGDRVLVKNQSTASENGIYAVASGSWTRPADANLASEMGGAVVNVDSGTQGGQLWTTSFKTTDTLGTTAMNWYRVVDTSYTIPVSQGGTGATNVSDAQTALQIPLSPNYIINGAFDFNQRGFTSTTTNNSYGFDRWAAFLSAATATYSAQQFVVGTTIGSEQPKNYARIVTSGQTGTTVDTRITQRIEDVRLLASKNITVSFWARSGSGTPSVSVEIAQSFGSGGSPSGAVLGSVATNTTKKIVLSGGTTWTRYSANLSVPSIAGKTLGTNNDHFTGVSFWVSAGSDRNTRTDSLGIQSNTFDFWGVQLEEGSVATTFRRNANSIQGELAACQRYFVAFPAASVEIINSYFGVALNSGSQRIPVNFPVPMLKTPTITNSSGTALHVFTYYPTNAGSNRTANITITGRNNVAMLGSYDSANNGAGTLAAVYATGDNNNPIWVNAEL